MLIENRLASFFFFLFLLSFCLSSLPSSPTPQLENERHEDRDEITAK